MKKMLNEYDDTKKMLKFLRNLNESSFTKTNLIKEQDDKLPSVTDTKAEEPVDDFMVINDVEVTVVSDDKADMKFDEEEKNAISGLIDNFKTQVSQIVEFEPGITIDKNQIRLDGQLTDEEIGFVFIAGDNGGLYLNLDMVELDTSILPILEKLQKFNETYKTTMEPIVNKLSNN